MSTESILRDLREEIDNIKMIDTHEHIRKQSDLISEGGNLFTSLKYSLVCMDFISAGMPPKYWENNFDEEENWKRIKPYLDSVKTTSYYSTLLMNTYKNLYGFKYDEITDENWRELSGLIKKAYSKDDFYDSVFKKLNVEVAFLDPFWDPGYISEKKQMFLPAPGMDPFIFVRSGKTRIPNPGGFNVPWWLENPLRTLLKNWNTQYESFEEFLSLIDRAFETLKQEGGVGIKLRIGYSRSLFVDKVTKIEAERAFYLDEEAITKEDIKKIEDFVVRKVIQRAIDYKFPIQIHTGLQGTLGGYPQLSNPLQLTNLFREYPQAKFIIFHGSYPWASEAGALAKGYPNVYLELCWLSWLLVDAMKKYLDEWLALVPINKIMVGGDSECVDRMFTAVTLSKKIFSEVMAERVSNGYYNMETAKKGLRMIFRDNPREMYNLS
jgi:hypothetical protein